MSNDNFKIKVSVVIPCRNEQKYIGQCLDSITKQSYGIDKIEVLVSDGRSTDNTRVIIGEFTEKYPQIKLVDNEKLVAPVAMNLGIKQAIGQVIIIFGAHAFMDKDYVKNAVEKLQSADIMCVGGRIVNISENSLAEAISLSMSSPFGVGNALFRYSEKEQLTETVAFGAYKREVFDKIGYFDEQFVRNQDDEFNYRLTLSGGKILLTPEIISHYYTRGSFSKLWKQYYQYGFWKVRVIQKHKRPAAIRHLIPMLFVISLVFGAGLSIFYKVIGELFSLEILAYFTGAFYFAGKVVKHNKKQIFRVVYCFIILHLSYGIGFLQGIKDFYILKTNKSIEDNSTMSR